MEPNRSNNYSSNKSKYENTRKRKRCPNGTRRNKITGECVPYSTQKSTIQTRAQTRAQTQTRKISTRTRKSSSKKLETNAPLLETSLNKESVTIAENIVKTMVDKAIMSNKYSKSKLTVKQNPSPHNIKTQQKDLINSMEQSIVSLRSYSPVVNQQLVSLRNGTVNPLFACGVADVFGTQPVSKNTIEVGVLTKSGYKCVDFKTKAAQHAMMSTFKANKPIVYSDLIMPIQGHNNCWFNTWFAVFFVSDKGRKFFRYLRQYMITGKKIDGQLIKPTALANTLKLLNLCIEATYNNSGLADPALVINTNSIIDFLHASIEKLSVTQRGERKGLPQLGKYANPINFYNILSSYLSDNIIKLSIVSKLDNVEHSEGKILRVKEANNMDVILIRTWENIRGREDSIPSSNFIAPLSFTTSDSKFEFVMDSVIVRDIKGKHFVALLTCNGNEFGYDGGGFTSIKPFKWKELLSSKKKWKIPGSKVTCSFTQSFCEYFYYKK